MVIRHTLLLLVLGFMPVRVCMAEESSPPARTPREYGGRVQMHNMPTDVRMPDAVAIPERQSLSDKLNQEARPPDFSSFQTSPSQMPQPPIRRDREKERRSRNWIRLGEDSSETTGKERESRTDSGWGWLAEDVLEQQETDRAKAEEEEDEAELEAFMLPTDRLLQSVGGQGGLLVQPMASPSATASILRETPSPDVGSMLVLEEDRDTRRDSRAQPATSRDISTRSPDRGAPPSGAPVMTTSAGISPQGGFDASPKTVLPQTASLLARPAEMDSRRGTGLRPEGLNAMSPSASLSQPSLFSPSQVGGLGSPASSWASPSAPPRSMFDSFGSQGTVASPGSSGFSFDRDPFGSSPSTPAATPAPARPTIDFQGPSWRR